MLCLVKFLCVCDILLQRGNKVFELEIVVFLQPRLQS